jgi:uncharacterized membrane protein
MAQEGSESRNPFIDRLKSEARDLVGALSNRAMTSVRDKLEGTTGRLSEYADSGGGPGLMAAVTGAKNLAEGKSGTRSLLGAGLAGVKEKVAGLFGKGKGGGSRKLKLTSIVESVDVGVPVKVAYNQWTQYSDFPKFTKKVEGVDQPEETKTNWKAQVLWSHRTWEATVMDQVPDDRIVWRSKGPKGHVDGAVTFHELAPNLTRILVVLEYHPQGLFERTGNLWRAQGRRARLEIKHFRRHMMTEGILHADELEGWRGTIRDGEVVESHEDAVAREEKERPQRSGSRRSRASRADDAAEGQSGDGQGSADEPEEDAERRDDTGNGRASSARARSGASNRSRSPARTRASGSAGNGRRRRAGTAAERGGSR